MEINIKMNGENIPCVTASSEDFISQLLDPVEKLEGQKVVEVIKEGRAYTLLFENGSQISFEGDF